MENDKTVTFALLQYFATFQLFSLLPSSTRFSLGFSDVFGWKFILMSPVSVYFQQMNLDQENQIFEPSPVNHIVGNHIVLTVFRTQKISRWFLIILSKK